MKTVEEKKLLRVQLLSTLLIGSVAALEITAGVVTNSLAVLGDGFHAFYDTLVSALLLVTYSASLKPADESHTYGHSRIKTLGAFTSGMAFFFLVILLFIRSVDRLTNPSTVYLDLTGFIAIAYTLIVDVIRITTLSRVADEEEVGVKAGLLNSLADFADTLIALLGFLLAGYFSMLYADAVAGILLAAMMSYLGLKLLYETGLELTDTVPSSLVRRIRKTVEEKYGKNEISYLNVRRFGEKVYVDVGTFVPRGSSVASLHEDFKNLEEAIAKTVKEKTVVRIQTIPKEPGSLYELIKDSALGVEGVLNVHEVTISRVGRSLFISLHIEVPDNMNLSDAHKIADEVEEKALKSVKNIGNVMVHIEPIGSSISTIKNLGSDSSLYLKVKEAVENEVKRGFYDVRDVKKIMVFRDASGSARVELAVSMESGKSIAEAHDVASRLEDDVKHAVGRDIEVVVHVEPEEIRA